MAAEDESLQGKLLIATPMLRDPNFNQTVTLVVRHDEEGALGLVLNRPSQTTLSQAWAGVSETPCPHEGYVYQGGPCPGPLMILHEREELADLQVCAGLWFSTDADHARALMEASAGPLRCFVGYAGWGATQLESELQTGCWLTLPVQVRRLWEPNPRLWLDACRSADPNALDPRLNPRSVPPDPSFN
jgi:putative transcriptional regulator